jgi:hypothetical protein
MNTNIEISNIKTNFSLNNERKNQNKQPYNTKIVTQCFNSINEANISDKIKNMMYYINNYAVVEDYDFVNIGQLDEKFVEKINATDNKRYLLFKYKKERLIDFNDFLFRITKPKTFIFNIIESFLHLLTSLIKLNNESICFFNLSSENIGFNLDCGEKPIIHNFQLSLQVSKLNERYITNIIKNLDNYTNKPLEVHILFYLIQNDISSISYSFIEEVCEKFVSNLSILNIFSENYKETYKSLCIESLKIYINKPNSYIIEQILKQNNKWDVYSISLLYLHIFGNISRVFSLNHNVISKITTELSKNIHPDPSKRASLEELLENVNKLLNNDTNWAFVNMLPANKMSRLMDLLTE